MKYLLVVWVLILYLVLPGEAFAQTKPPYTIIPGLGTDHHPVSTQNSEAQKFFDQGLNLVYAFNHDEAVRSFKHAAELDPQMAMAYWGIALALGPNINAVITTEKEQLAYQAIQEALALSRAASAPEKDYITALAKRYSPDTQADLHQLDVDYAKAMATLTQRYPNDLDAATLFAESLMDLHPWQLWTHDGKPQPDTEEIVAVLESVLQKDPNHAGANHYYIHAIEASLHPERALESAKRLENLAPTAGHLVHMPSHIYFRVGDYERARRVNEQAIAQDVPYICHNQIRGIYPQLYLSHNLHFLMVANSMVGRYHDALLAADKLVAHATSIDPHLPMLEGFLGNKMLMQARFSDWDAVLQTPVPHTTLPTTTAIWHFTRGLAYAAQGDMKDAADESRALLAATHIIPAEATIGFTPASRILNLAQKLLDAKIAKANHDYNSAIEILQQAVAAEDALDYVEPPDWYFPTREALGGVLLAKGDYADAETVFQADLAKYPHNGRSLFGLQVSLQALEKNAQSQQIQSEFATAWKNADTQLEIEQL
ncbi:tetratricopeptide repeat protein [Anabaena subtropica]|uniref:Tetratricopeptide repeat protein n=1 Tax=Anabaena subtropica FACHB-260 TaxID=2692884 RepID=A0ABR8CXZ0_9NOST|nr:tetratricopeptide repeat protein [Anabaena subtropica]MBD2347143.1 tetratricopeptide repeat protein [Anabaena subtropica FACHB-260]